MASNHGIYIFDTLTSADSEPGNKPMAYRLFQNYPNPFNGRTAIEFDAPGNRQIVIGLYNVIGQNIKTLLNANVPRGHHSIQLESSNLSSGVYLYRLEVGVMSITKKMVIMR